LGDDGYCWWWCFQGPMHISKYGKWGCAKCKIAIKYRKKSGKKIGGWCLLLVMMFSGSTAHFQIWKYLYFYMKNSHKIWKKSEKNRDSGQYCWMVLSGSWVDVLKRKFRCLWWENQKKLQKNSDGIYTVYTMKHSFQGPCQGALHVP